MQRLLPVMALGLMALLLAGCADFERQLNIAMYGSEEEAQRVQAKYDAERNEKLFNDLRKMEKKAHELIASKRKAERKTAFPWNEDIQVYASTRAAELAERYDKYRPDGTLYTTLFNDFDNLHSGDKKPGKEARARGISTPEKVVEYWMRDPASRETIMGGINVRYAVGAFREGSTYYWVFSPIY